MLIDKEWQPGSCGSIRLTQISPAHPGSSPAMHHQKSDSQTPAHGLCGFVLDAKFMTLTLTLFLRAISLFDFRTTTRVLRRRLTLPQPRTTCSGPCPESTNC